MDIFIIIKIIALITTTFLLAILWTPALTHILYKYKLGKKIREESAAPIMAKLHAHKAGTPTMGGVLIWLTVLFVAIALWILDAHTNIALFDHFNFLTRSQTLLPLGAMVAAALIGMVDDYLNIKGIGPKGGGLSMGYRLLSFTIIAIIAAFWFYFKLDWDLLRVPFLGDFQIGAWYIPLAIFVIVATTFSVNETDGLDGLAAGTLTTSFTAFGVIAFSQGRYDLAALCGSIVGGLLAFMWFNVIPARFYMGDTGAMALGVTLGLVAMLTNSILLLPIIGFVLVIESLSVIIQIASKKIRKKKFFLSAPLHHHLEASGWPEAKIVMRFWIISAVMAGVGIIISLLDLA
ncbi:phospho-N-acetylmuramoyl-pentapeptide-transferase [Candidatus Falkowbacteria bacterium]|nr:phospho-N-acetylmuramoyl-pentapeptide-transferase [Candidatus Falkowbacteria bacterium]